MRLKNKNPVRAAVRAFGPSYELARALGVSPPTISVWCQKGQVSPEVALPFHNLTGLPLWLVNSQIYPKRIFFAREV